MPQSEAPTAMDMQGKGAAAAHEPIHRLVQRAAVRFAGAPAIDAGDRPVTHGELDRRAGGLAAALTASGVVRGDLVAILATTSADMIAAILAVLRAGGAFVPLDLHSPATRLEAAVAAVRPTFWLIARECSGLLRRLEGEVGFTAKTVVLEEHAEGPGESAAPEADLDPLDPDALSYVYFTSGSTGRPKAIAGRLKAIDHFIRWEIETFGLGPGVRVSQLTSPSFDAFLRDAFVPLAAGGTVCPPPSRDLVLDGARLAQWIGGAGLNLVHCTPSLFRLILAQDLKSDDFPALRHVLMAGEPLLPTDVRRWRAVFGERIELVNLYGPSETTMIKLFHRLGPDDATAAVIPIGRPMPGARAVVLDDKQRPCPPGKMGEIYIRTPYRTLGYLNQPELTREAFVRNPLSDAADDIVYRTGDLGRMRDDGSFEIIGRRDQQVKVRGVRVEIAPIEDLLRSQAGVADAAVIDRTDSQGNTFLCAYLVLRGEVDAAGFGELLRSRLPEAMVPSAWVVLDALPRTLSGKLDRRELPEPGRLDSRLGRELVAPRTPVEERLCQLFREVLSTSEVGIFDDFFAMGGHSLLVAQLLARTRREFGAEVSLHSFFQAPTVAGMAVALAQGKALQADPAEMAKLVADLENLSDEEIRGLLAAGTTGGPDV
jgi:amino acid adenylation domain-containing protein